MVLIRSAIAVLALLVAAAPAPALGYWMDEIPHVGRSPGHTDPNYQVFRNVKAFGAKGDGVTDDTAAINRAISSGGRCAPQACSESTTSPAIVYFPSGTYKISGSIIDYFYTQLIGDPNNLPVIKAAANFPTTSTLGLLDGNRYGADGLAWKAVNVFYRQVRNLVFDTTSIPATANAVAVHWPSSQATVLSNVIFRLSEAAGTNHVGLLIEEGSGGLLCDLQFVGGRTAARLGNQQYTARNWSIRNAQVGIEMLWDWGWTFKSLAVSSTAVAIKIADAHTAGITLLDSVFTNVGTAVAAAVDPAGRPNPSVGTLVVWNTVFNRVATLVRSPSRVLWAGSSQSTISGVPFAMGNVYAPTGPRQYVGTDPQYFGNIPSSLMRQGRIYERSKPQYNTLSRANVATARGFGAKGDGVADDTAALQNLFNHAAANPTKIAFVDAGHYLVRNTVTIPPGARVVGEALASLIIGTGANFANANSPRPVVRVGGPGQTGVVEWSDMLVSTRGPAAGAKLIEWNLASPSASPSGMWDVHTRVGGYWGSALQRADCPITSGSAAVKPNCIAAHTSMHITPSAAGLYVEGAWFWVADHDLEDPGFAQVTVHAGRGVLIESTAGPVWLSGVGSEHHALYQFQLANTQNVYMGQPQSETPYHQPNPGATQPFAPSAALNDPDFRTDCANGAGRLAGAPCDMAWGLRVVGARNVAVFGAGFYSFFNDNSDACAQKGSPADCQARIVDIRNGKAATANLAIYGLNTVGSAGMVRRLGQDVALSAQNGGEFADGLAVYVH